MSDKKIDLKRSQSKDREEDKKKESKEKKERRSPRHEADSNEVKRKSSHGNIDKKIVSTTSAPQARSSVKRDKSGASSSPRSTSLQPPDGEQALRTSNPEKGHSKIDKDRDRKHREQRSLSSTAVPPPTVRSDYPTSGSQELPPRPSHIRGISDEDVIQKRRSTGYLPGVDTVRN